MTLRSDAFGGRNVSSLFYNLFSSYFHLDMQTTKLHFFCRDLCIPFFSYNVSHSVLFITLRQCETIQEVHPNCIKCAVAIFWGTTLSIDSHPASCISSAPHHFPLCMPFPFSCPQCPTLSCPRVPTTPLQIGPLFPIWNFSWFLFALTIYLKKNKKKNRQPSPPLLYPSNLNFHSPWPQMSTSRQALLSVGK